MIRTAQKAPEKQKPGPKPSGRAKTMIALRVDKDVLAKFKATGPGWQTRMNEALKAVEPQQEQK